MPILFALVGATGIGKSCLSLELAEKYDADIIGVDSRQIYEGFAIGTAQPGLDDLKRVPHHLVNFLNPEESYSAGRFVADVKEILQESPNHNFILVGGTGLYLQSLMLGLPEIPPVDVAVRSDLEDMAERNGLDSLYEMACRVDPEAMANVDKNNMQRVVRILEVYRTSGKKLSEWQKDRRGGIGKIPVFSLCRSRENLYARINARVDQMMKDGWMDEVRLLAKTVPSSAPAWQSLGYRELLAASTAVEVERVLDDVKKKTRNYAKRQLTWFRWQVESEPIDLDTETDCLTVVECKLTKKIF